MQDTREEALSKRLVIILFCTLCAATVVLAISRSTQNVTWKYEITVVVSTPEGDKSGSQIWEVSLAPQKFNNAIGYQERVRGEAVAVALGNRGHLFALMRSANGQSYVRQVMYWAFPYEGRSNAVTTDQERITFYSNLIGRKVVLKPDYYPQMVAVGDLGDPRTIQTVYKRKRGSIENMAVLEVDRVEEVYGEGVAIKEVTIQMTDDVVTFHLDEILPWIGNSNSEFIELNSSSGNSGPLAYTDFQRK